jgi:hypothetical protein
MKWIRHTRGDRWFLFPTNDGGKISESLGKVERIGIRYEASIGGVSVGIKSSLGRAEKLVEEQLRAK